MKKKINRYLLLTVLLTILATISMAIAVFHHMFQEQILDDMKLYAHLLGGMALSGESVSSQYQELTQDMRITVIDTQGAVIYDSRREGGLGNHGNRPEVQEAQQSGEGYAIRHSDTMGRDLYYYAVRLSDGDILRISREADSLWGVFQQTIVGIIGIGLLMFLLCLLLSRYITNGIVRPIEQMAGDIDRIEELDTYEELVPFITTIRQQHADILKSAKMRQEFTANVSHELKTPLTSISGYSELIETGLAGENEVQRFAAEIHRNSRRLLRLINDIIRLSELDADDMEVAFSDQNLYEAANACVESVRLHAENHGIHIACRGVNCTVQANREMLDELVSNLCDNAIRYNRPGGTVDVAVFPQGDQVVLSVKDTGIGIPKESQERVFERFYRVDKSRSKQTGGTGLGLAIVKHIVAQHHAVLELKSEVGIGTEVRVIFARRTGA